MANSVRDNGETVVATIASATVAAAPHGTSRSDGESAVAEGLGVRLSEVLAAELGDPPADIHKQTSLTVLRFSTCRRW